MNNLVKKKNYKKKKILKKKKKLQKKKNIKKKKIKEHMTYTPPSSLFGIHIYCVN